MMGHRQGDCSVGSGGILGALAWQFRVTKNCPSLSGAEVELLQGGLRPVKAEIWVCWGE